MILTSAVRLLSKLSLHAVPSAKILQNVKKVCLDKFDKFCLFFTKNFDLGWKLLKSCMAHSLLLLPIKIIKSEVGPIPNISRQYCF
jgi:hypothetical protein